MFKPSVLIVDDEKAARYGMKKILLKDNYVVHEAKDSTDALHDAGRECGSAARIRDGCVATR